jgi:hypothetical protein
MKEGHDIRALLESCLAGTPGIIGAAYFGSGATNTSDRYSDIDLVVGSEGGTADHFLLCLHGALPIVLFRPFTEDRRPSGRYWFSNANPFARLDVSFYHPGDLEDVLNEGRGFAQPPFRRVSVGPRRQTGPPAGSLPNWNSVDHEFAGALRRFHESAKALARRRPPKHPIEESEKSLREFEPEGVRREAWALYARSLEVIGRSA